jgi:hypothetical protein
VILGVGFIQLIPAIVADSLSVRIQNHCVAPTIADDHPMASIKFETLSFELQDHFEDWFQTGGLIPWFFH